MHCRTGWTHITEELCIVAVIECGCWKPGLFGTLSPDVQKCIFQHQFGGLHFIDICIVVYLKQNFSVNSKCYLRHICKEGRGRRRKGYSNFFLIFLFTVLFE